MTDFLSYASGDAEFAAWLVRVDKVIRSRTYGEICLFDLADCSLRDLYDDGLSPREAALDALENDDIGSMILLETE